MLEISPAARVGIITVIALLLLGVIVSSLGGWNRPREEGVQYHVIFTQVGGLTTANEVRYSGVKIGKVQDIVIRADGKVEVTILVTTKPLTLTHNSMFTVSGDLFGLKWLEISPKNGPPLAVGGVVEGQPPVSVDEMMKDSKAAVAQVKEAAASLNKIIGDPQSQAELKRAIANVEDITVNMKSATATLNSGLAEISSNANHLVTAIHRHADAAAKEMISFSRGLNRLVTENKDDLEVVIQHLRSTSHYLNTAMKSMSELMASKAVTDDLPGTLVAIHKAAEEIEGVATDIHSLTSDPGVKEDLKGTIREARNTLEGTSKLLKRLNGMVGADGGGDSGGAAAGGNRLYAVESDVEWRTRDGQAAANLNATLFPYSPLWFKVGADNLGHGRLFNIEAGVRKGAFGAHGGIIRSNLGVGLDATLNRQFDIAVDGYDPQNFKVDIMGKLRLPYDFYVTGGLRNAFNSISGGTVIGVGKRF